MKKLIILLSIINCQILFSQSIDVPRRILFEKLIKNEEYNGNLTIKVRNKFVLDDNSVIYDVYKSTRNSVDPHFVLCEVENDAIKTTVLEIKRKMSNALVHPTNFFKKDKELFAFRFSKKGKKIKLFLDKIIEGKQVVQDEPLYEFTTDFEIQDNFSLNKIGDNLVISFLEQDKNNGVEFKNIFFDINDFKFKFEKNTKLEIEPELNTAHNEFNLQNEIQYKLNEEKLYFSVTSRIQNSRDIYLGNIDEKGEFLIEKIVDTKNAENGIITFTSFYIKNDKIFYILNSINKEGITIINYSVDEITEISKTFLPIQDVLIDVLLPTELQITYTDEVEVINDEKRNTFLFFYQKRWDINNELGYIDIVLVKLNSKNEIIFSKSIDRSWRKSYQSELFPHYNFENSEIVYEDLENEKSFNGNEYIKNQNKDFSKKVTKVIVTIDQESGDVKRELIPNLK